MIEFTTETGVLVKYVKIDEDSIQGIPVTGTSVWKWNFDGVGSGLSEGHNLGLATAIRILETNGILPLKSEAVEDPVNHPSHYTSHPSGIECITITRWMSFNIGNVFKYCWRSGLKDPAKEIADLKKARFYLDDEINRLENKPSSTIVAK